MSNLRRCGFAVLSFAMVMTNCVSGFAAEPELHWLSSGLNNRDLTISPAGDLLFSSVMAPGNQFAVIVMSRKVDGQWQPPEIAPFSGTYADIEPMFDPSGEHLYFSSKRPRAGRPGDDWDIWVTHRAASGWSTPENLGEPVNGPGNEFYPSVGASGNLYFTTEREGGVGAEDIFRAIREGGAYVRVEPLGTGVNTVKYEFNAFVAADESYILFTSQGRDNEIGGGDLYVSRRDAEGTFAPAQMLSTPINSTTLDYCPFVWQGRLFFSSRRAFPPAKLDSFDQLRSWLESPGNGMGDIYSVAIDLE